MTIKPLYRYERASGGITVSPKKPRGKAYTELVRIIADDGKLVTNDGVNMFSCIDTDVAEGWYEVEAAEGGIEL